MVVRGEFGVWLDFVLHRQNHIHVRIYVKSFTFIIDKFYRYASIPANLKAEFVGLAFSSERDNSSFVIEIPPYHVTSSLQIIYEALWKSNASHSQASSKHILPWIWLLLIAVILVIFFILVVRHAWRHPASHPGRMLVRLRMTFYNKNSPNLQSNLRRTDSVLTENTIFQEE